MTNQRKSRIFVTLNTPYILYIDETKEPEKTHQLSVRRTAGRMYCFSTVLEERQHAGCGECHPRHCQDAERHDLPHLTCRAWQYPVVLQKDEGGHTETYG